jgi:hypothetical protein
MKFDKDKLLAKSQTYLAAAQRYSVFLAILAFLGIYGFLVTRISTLVQGEPNATAVSEQQKTITPPKIDQESIDKMLQLEDQNVEVKSLFDQARDNPFNE